MAQAKRSDLLGRLFDAGEEAIQRLADAPGGDRVVGAVGAMRDRVDELQKRVRGLEDLERRLAALERKVDKLSRSSSTPAKRSTTKKSTAK